MVEVSEYTFMTIVFIRVCSLMIKDKVKVKLFGRMIYSIKEIFPKIKLKELGIFILRNMITMVLSRIIKSGAKALSSSMMVRNSKDTFRIINLLGTGNCIFQMVRLKRVHSGLSIFDFNFTQI